MERKLFMKDYMTGQESLNLNEYCGMFWENSF